MEDEPLVRDLTHTLLTELGYTVLNTRSGDEAFALMETNDTPID